jgi:hypothetical protein
MVGTASHAAGKARRAERSTPVDRMARFGLVSRGIVWLLVGLLALDIASGGGARADRNGAFAVIKDQPFGGVLLTALAVGFAGYGLWRLLQAAVGHQDERADTKRWAKRGASLFRGVVYVGLAVSTLHFLTSGSGGDNTKPVTARAMAEPGGTLLVGLVGASLVIGGLVMAVRGLKQDFDDDLKPVPHRWRTPVKVVGTVGMVGRGLVFALLGWFLVDAAVTFDANKAKGLDAALKTLAKEAYGSVLLTAAAVGLMAFALWSFAEARWRKI